MNKKRRSGILMHITSLPSPYGIGTMGKAAYEFVDFLKSAGQSAWQVLPIGHTSFGDSPYQSYSSYAGNPYLIDLDMLAGDSLIEKSDFEDLFSVADDTKADYKMMFEKRYIPLKKAALALLENPPIEYNTFLEENIFWLDDYASFMVLKEQNGWQGRDGWKSELRYKNEQSESVAETEKAAVYKAIQFLFFKQWFALKNYANERGIEIIGDMPIYCASDSADVWAEPQIFELDEKYLPKRVAGCPPDAFSPEGQRWGNPIYDWDYIEDNGFKWWIERIAFAHKIFDIVRIDHFRGFDSYYAIDRRYKTAVKGRWEEGPKKKLFSAIFKKLGDDLPIIAEDLGYLTDGVRKLLEYTGFPGMKILQFAFDSRESTEYMAYNYPINSVCYVGTHDNNTAEGWFKEADDCSRLMAKEYFNLTEDEGIAYGMIRGAMESNSFLCVISMQDVLKEDGAARMNTPSTSEGNWMWRMKRGGLDKNTSERLCRMTRLFGR